MLIEKKRISMTFVSLGFLVASTQAVAQFDSGSDGSDGDFVPVGVVEIDLSLAVDGPWNTPGTGNGVYDANVWAVVFKYATINVPIDAAITFKNHPSGAPVVWLSQGDVTIDGTINLDGEAGHLVGAQLPRLSEPGPGGFEGGHCGFFTNSGTLESSAGLGLGGGPFVTTRFAGGGGYGTPGINEGEPSSDTYGSESLSPLIGGSGGAVGRAMNCNGGGGAGAGAILIASSSEITLNGEIAAIGGFANNNAGWGSGGAIRLVANTVSGPGLLKAHGGFTLFAGGLGRIRVEAFANNIEDPGNPRWIGSLPGPVFPPANAPTLTVVSVDNVAAGADPKAGILTGDLLISNENLVPVLIQTTGIPADPGTVVTIRVVPYRGQEIVVTSTQLTGTCAAASVTIDVPNYPRGNSELYVKANWDPQDGCQ